MLKKILCVERRACDVLSGLDYSVHWSKEKLEAGGRDNVLLAGCCHNCRSEFFSAQGRCAICIITHYSFTSFSEMERLKSLPSAVHALLNTPVLY